MKEQKQKSLIKWTFFRYGCMKQLMIGLIKLYRKSVKEISLLSICTHLFAVCDSGIGKIWITEGEFFGCKKNIALSSVCKGRI